MAKRIRLKEGDVFYFSDEEKRCGVGQIIVKEINEYIIVYDKIIPEDDVANVKIDTLSPLLAGWTTDARIYSGDWKIIGNSAYRPPYEFPLFKVKRNNVYCVVDPFRHKIRDATEKDIKNLNHPFSRSPIGYENAFWGFHGKREWRDLDSKLIVEGMERLVRPC